MYNSANIDSKYYQKTKTDISPLEALMMYQGSWIDLHQDQLEALSVLKELRLLSYQNRYFIKCFLLSDIEDNENRNDSTNINCDNQIYIEDNFNEDHEELICSSCGRYILPNTHNKYKFLETTIKLNYQEITMFLEETMRLQQLPFYLLSQGVYAVISKYGTANVIFVDICKDPKYLAINKLKATPTLLIPIRAKFLHTKFNICTLSIVNIIKNSDIFVETIEKLCKTGVSELLSNQSANILPFPFINLSRLS